MAAKSGAEHLNAFHKAAREFHSKMAEAHRGQLKKAGGGGADEAAESARAYHEACIAAHTAMEFFHNTAQAETRKAADDELRKSSELVPTQISAVIDPAKSGVRPVLRAGQRDFGGAIPKVAEGFEHLVKIDD